MPKSDGCFCGFPGDTPRIVDTRATYPRSVRVDEAGRFGKLMPALAVGSAPNGSQTRKNFRGRRGWSTRRPCWRREFRDGVKPSAYPGDYRLRAEPRLFCKVRRGVGDAVDGDRGGTTLVARLPCLCGPKAIVRPVITIRVSSINGVERGRLVPDISDKIGEILPSFANTDPAPTVVSEVVDVWVAASRKNAAPSAVEWMANAHDLISKSRQNIIIPDEGTQP